MAILVPSIVNHLSPHQPVEKGLAVCIKFPGLLRMLLGIG
jgi:hypothetical protein